MCESRPRIQRMNYVNAELTKLSVNTFVTTKISYANMLAQVCETLPGADVDVVTSAIGCDSRIGSQILRARWLRRPCFPRDNIAFSALARTNGVPALLAEATDELNRRQIPRLAELILSRLPKDGVAGILGLAYKPDTDVIEESQGLGIAKELLARGADVIVYDPAAMNNARALLNGRVTFASSAAECLRGSDVVAITTAWPEFRSLSPEDLKVGGHKPVVVDCWRVLSSARFGAAAEFVALGSAPASKFNRHTAVGAASAAEAD